MSHDAALPCAISEPLTWKEICRRHPDEWVSLVEIDWLNDIDFAFRTARIAGHAKRRRDSMAQAHQLRMRYPSIGHFFTGHIGVSSPLFL